MTRFTNRQRRRDRRQTLGVGSRSDTNRGGQAAPLRASMSLRSLHGAESRRCDRYAQQVSQRLVYYLHTCTLALSNIFPIHPPFQVRLCLLLLLLRRRILPGDKRTQTGQSFPEKFDEKFSSFGGGTFRGTFQPQTLSSVSRENRLSVRDLRENADGYSKDPSRIRRIDDKS